MTDDRGALEQAAESPDDLLGALTYPSPIGVVPGLARMHALLHAIGDPQDGLPVVHVGGTSGKGSTAAIVAEVLRAAGYRVGLHSKPHLRRVEERLVVDGTPIRSDALSDLLREATPAAREVRPTWFELTVALALVYFRRLAVDVAVIEVGLGGTHDGTNVVHPMVAVLTNVGLDHTEVLGDTVEAIAADKVGIIKPGCTAVAGISQPSVRAIVERRSADVGAPLWLLGRELRPRVRGLSEEGGVFDLDLPGQHYCDLELGLVGAHQIANATLALGAVQALAGFGYHAPEPAVRSALASVRVPGRLEVVRREPTLVLDGAHNPDKMAALAEALRSLFHWRRLIAVLAFKRGHDPRASLATLAPLLDRVVLTRFEATTDFGKDTAQSPDAISAALESLRARCEIRVEEPAEAALALALAEASADDLVLVTGSLYLVGQLRAAIPGE